MYRHLISLAVIFGLSGAVFSETKPYTCENALTLESISDLQGGVEKGTHNLANVDLTLTIDTDTAGWWQSGKVFVYVLGDYGQHPSELTGELQTLSNIEAKNSLKIYEFWYQHSFANDTVKVLIGLHDHNATFYSLDSAGLFSLASFGVGPDVSQATPSIFPTTATTVLLSLAHDEQYLHLAVYDGIPGKPGHPQGTHIIFKKSDGLYKAAEWGFAHEKSYKLGVGYWQHTAQVENPVDGSISHSNSGYYTIGEKYLSEDLAIFFQYGRADDKKNQLDTYEGTGVTLSNIWVKEDSIGLGYASAHNGTPYLQMNPDLTAAETAFELTYLIPISEEIKFQSSLYYVQHPSMAKDVDNAVALGLRLYIDF